MTWFLSASQYYNGTTRYRFRLVVAGVKTKAELTANSKLLRISSTMVRASTGVAAGVAAEAKRAAILAELLKAEAKAVLLKVVGALATQSSALSSGLAGVTATKPKLAAYFQVLVR